MTSDQVRSQFIDFFVSRHRHTLVPSSPVVPMDDPSLLFTNAGMNQFKPIFLGLERRPYTRAVNSQKCIRAGGKHNDLDDVGRSRRHHTFFEMLGNWSFGDYFKAGAIEMAWELLTKVWKLDPTRLHVSCYEGNESAGIPRDTEAADLWKKIAGMPDDHIHYFGKDNFWEMGDTGPCGPCTEIYIDRTPDKTGGPQVNGDDPRVMEIWNLVFIQYNRDEAGKLTPLPEQHVDTGMGFERLCQVLEGKQDNYAIDLWQPLFARISELSGLRYTGKFPPTNSVDPIAESADPQLRHDIAFRVVADHTRCLTFALTDGALPSNEGRGYVLRRILRRAVRFGRQQLGLTEPFLHTLVPVVVESMGHAFPELREDPGKIAEIVRDEEVSFSKTLDRGIRLFERAATSAAAWSYCELKGFSSFSYARQSKVEVFGLEERQTATSPELSFPSDASLSKQLLLRESEVVEELRAAGKPIGIINADDAFKLHDTYGFPIDLTRIMAEERGMTVDIAGYETLMKRAQEIARSGGRSDQSARLAELPPTVMKTLGDRGIPATDDSPKYARGTIDAKVLAIWDGQSLQESSDPAGAGDVAVILDRTNFYAEMGGQVGDRGRLGLAFEVVATRAVGGYVLHIGRGKIALGDTVSLSVDAARSAIEKNHTATHLANWALREVLGEGVQQKGSLVDADRLRFDFSHSSALSELELERVESLVNELVKKNLPVYAEEAPQGDALKINGLRAVFGEKYPPMVRVVSIGVPVDQLLADPGSENWRQHSIEFCGGTHLAKTGEAGAFALTAEESVSKGIRRIAAVTGEKARSARSAMEALYAEVTKAMALAAPEMPPAIARLQKSAADPNLPILARRHVSASIAEMQAAVKAWEKTAKKSAGTIDVGAIAGRLLAESVDIGGTKVIIGSIPDASEEHLRQVVDSLKKKSAGACAVMVASAAGDKIAFVAAVSDELIARGLKAGDWIKATAAVAGGGGGGRPQMAQGSGKDPAKLEAALAEARRVAAKTLGKN